MKTLNFPTSACRLCHHYQPEGRRGGTCQQLGVPVRSNWKACSLALPPFSSSWEKIEVLWQDDNLLLQEALSVKCSLDYSQADLPKEQSPSTSETINSDMVLV